MKFIPCDEHEDCNETIPIFVTTDIQPNPLSRLYLIDVENIEIPYCDCINFDMDGNPKCPIHKGKLQTFYPQHDIITADEPQSRNHIMELNEKLPYCNKYLGFKHYVIQKGYVTCKNCIINEFKARRRRYKAEELKAKMEDGYFYTVGELECKEFKFKGKVKNLK